MALVLDRAIGPLIVNCSSRSESGVRSETFCYLSSGINEAQVLINVTTLLNYNATEQPMLQTQCNVPGLNTKYCGMSVPYLGSVLMVGSIKLPCVVGNWYL